MRRLILVRHAAPLKQSDVPARDWPLSPAGQADAARLADLLAPCAPAAIIASDELKARQTAQPLADRLGLTVAVAPGLHEHERRSAGYLDDATFQATMARLFAEPDALVFGEETANQALARFSQAIADALALHPSGDLAVFTHGTVLSLFVAAHSHHDPMTFWYHLNLPAWVVFTLPNFTLLEAHMRLPNPPEPLEA
jgi:broad specificity phosphatase PhoE